MATAQTPFYMAFLQVGSLQIPCMPGARFSCPQNWSIPPIIGNYWQFNFGNGFRQPMVELTCVVRNLTTEVLSTTFLDLFFVRTDPTVDVAHDTSVISGGVTFWDGRTGFTINGAKADSFTISCQKGGDIAFNVRFVGTSFTPLVSAPTIAAWSNARVLRFDALTFLTTNLANTVWSFNNSFSNNHNPDMSLNGTAFAAAQNAGMMTAGFSYQTQANDTPIADGTPITYQIAGTSFVRKFTLNNPIDNTPDDRGVAVPRVMRSHTYYCLGGTSQSTAPMSYATA